MIIFMENYGESCEKVNACSIQSEQQFFSLQMTIACFGGIYSTDKTRAFRTLGVATTFVLKT